MVIAMAYAMLTAKLTYIKYKRRIYGVLVIYKDVFKAFN